MPSFGASRSAAWVQPVGQRRHRFDFADSGFSSNSLTRRREGKLRLTLPNRPLSVQKPDLRLVNLIFAVAPSADFPQIEYLKWESGSTPDSSVTMTSRSYAYCASEYLVPY